MSDITLYSILYIEINLFSIILVMIIQFRTLGLSRMVAQRNFSMSIYSMILLILSDTLWALMENKVLPYSATAVIALKDIYFFSASLMCYFWFVYFEYLQDSPLVARRGMTAASSVFVWIQLLLILINHFTPITYYVDENRVYRRGMLFVSLYAFSYVYVMFACARALHGFFTPSKKDQRRKLFKLVMFAFIPAIGGLIQYVLPRVPALCASLAIVVLVLYLDWTTELISVDPLTKLNNRKQLLFLYEQWTRNNDEHETIYVVMIDANRFKSINDTYGHIEGDAALVRIADAMKKGVAKYKDKVNIARYGGDEFVIIARGIGEEDISEMKKEIGRELQELNKKAKSPYSVTVSMGVARIDSSEGLSFSDAAEIADEDLYMQKRSLR